MPISVFGFSLDTMELNDQLNVVLLLIYIFTKMIIRLFFYDRPTVQDRMADDEGRKSLKKCLLGYYSTLLVHSSWPMEENTAQHTFFFIFCCWIMFIIMHF